MGYDMSIEAQMPEAEALARDAARDQTNAAVKERDALERNTPEWDAAQEKVMAAFDALDPLDTHYFRLNIWGMGRARRAMYEAGMVYDSSYSDGPQFPDYSPPTSAEGGREALELAEEEYGKAHEEACRPVIEHHPDGGDTIPLHKLSDNSGWHVTEEECAAAVTAWRTYDAARTKALPTLDEGGTDSDEADSDSIEATFAAAWWPQWIAFLDRASRRGGFRVY